MKMEKRENFEAPRETAGAHVKQIGASTRIRVSARVGSQAKQETPSKETQYLKELDAFALQAKGDRRDHVAFRERQRLRKRRRQTR